jgi:hypothetical protein
MPEKLSNNQKHERMYCAYTHWRIALSFATLCALEVFVTWKSLDKPVLRDGLFELSYYILLIVVCAPMLMTVLRCFSERFVIGVGTLVLAKAVVSWFAPTFFNPVMGLVERAFLVLWAIALVMSLNMIVQAVRDPYIGPDNGDAAGATRVPIIMGAFVVILFMIGMLMYFVR